MNQFLWWENLVIDLFSGGPSLSIALNFNRVRILVSISDLNQKKYNTPIMKVFQLKFVVCFLLVLNSSAETVLINAVGNSVSDSKYPNVSLETKLRKTSRTNQGIDWIGGVVIRGLMTIIPLELIHQITSSITTVIYILRFGPHKEYDENLAGYELGACNKGGFVELLGFKVRDAIIPLGNHILRSISNIYTVFKKLKESFELSLRIEYLCSGRIMSLLST